MDKILTEAFDKLKAIEESDDPFCIGELTENEEDSETYKSMGQVSQNYPSHKGKEVDYDMDDPHTKHEEELEEGVEDWAEPKTYEIGTDSGNHYAIHFQDEADKVVAFIEADGITVANFTVGGAGSMNARIQKPDELMNIVAEALKAANGQGM